VNRREENQNSEDALYLRERFHVRPTGLIIGGHKTRDAAPGSIEGVAMFTIIATIEFGAAFLTKRERKSL
jgi:hypothetical protein